MWAGTLSETSFIEKCSGQVPLQTELQTEVYDLMLVTHFPEIERPSSRFIANRKEGLLLSLTFYGLRNSKFTLQSYGLFEVRAIPKICDF